MVTGLVLRLFGRKRPKQTQTAEDEKGRGDDEPASWEIILTTFDRVQILFAASRLEDEGIPVRIHQESASTAIPVNVGLLGEIDLLVPKPMIEKALGILSDTLDFAELDDETAS